MFRKLFYSKPDVSVIPHTLMVLPRDQEIRWERNFIFELGRCPKYACISQSKEIAGPWADSAGSWLSCLGSRPGRAEPQLIRNNSHHLFCA